MLPAGCAHGWPVTVPASSRSSVGSPCISWSFGLTWWARTARPDASLEDTTGPAGAPRPFKADRRPVVITQNGQARAVMLDSESDDALRNAAGLLKLLAQGEEDVRLGRLRPQGAVCEDLESALESGERRRPGQVAPTASWCKGLERRKRIS